MKALIVILAAVVLCGCAETGHPPLDAAGDIPLHTGQRTAQQSDANACAAPRHRQPHGLADAATGEAFAMQVSFTFTPGPDGTMRQAQLDDPTKDWTYVPRQQHSQGCNPRRAHHYFA
jgi:hypothetical protein